jgi:hypothetical protein
MNDNSFKFFIPMRASDLSFNEALIWSYLVRAERSKTYFTKQQIAEGTGLDADTVRKTLLELEKRELAAADTAQTTKQDRRKWKAVKSDLFRGRNLGFGELLGKSGAKYHWSQFLLYFRFQPASSLFTVREVAVYCLAKLFARRKRTFRQSTFCTILGISPRAMRKIARRLRACIDWKKCVVTATMRTVPNLEGFIKKHQWYIDFLEERTGMTTQEVRARVGDLLGERGDAAALAWINANVEL